MNSDMNSDMNNNKDSEHSKAIGFKLGQKCFDFGTKIAVSFVFYIYVGYLLDIYFETSPIYILIGVAFSIISFIVLFSLLIKQLLLNR